MLMSETVEKLRQFLRLQFPGAQVVGAMKDVVSLPPNTNVFEGGFPCNNLSPAGESPRPLSRPDVLTIEGQTPDTVMTPGAQLFHQQLALTHQRHGVHVGNQDGDGEGALDGHRMAPTRLHLPGRSISRGGVCVSVASPGTDTGSWVEAIRLLKDAQDRNDPVEWCRFPNHIVL